MGRWVGGWLRWRETGEHSVDAALQIVLASASLRYKPCPRANIWLQGGLSGERGAHLSAVGQGLPQLVELGGRDGMRRRGQQLQREQRQGESAARTFEDVMGELAGRQQSTLAARQAGQPEAARLGGCTQGRCWHCLWGLACSGETL